MNNAKQLIKAQRKLKAMERSLKRKQEQAIKRFEHGPAMDPVELELFYRELMK